MHLNRTLTNIILIIVLTLLFISSDDTSNSYLLILFFSLVVFVYFNSRREYFTSDGSKLSIEDEFNREFNKLMNIDRSRHVIRFSCDIGDGVDRYLVVRQKPENDSDNHKCDQYEAVLIKKDDIKTQYADALKTHNESVTKCISDVNKGIGCLGDKNQCVKDCNSKLMFMHEFEMLKHDVKDGYMIRGTDLPKTNLDGVIVLSSHDFMMENNNDKYLCGLYHENVTNKPSHNTIIYINSGYVDKHIENNVTIFSLNVYFMFKIVDKDGNSKELYMSKCSSENDDGSINVCLTDDQSAEKLACKPLIVDKI
jgi:hypothetical protein